MYLENNQQDICFVGSLNYDIQLHEFIDSYWARSTDEIRSDTWIRFGLIFAMMSRARRKQKFVEINTTEADYIASCDACTKEIS
jgi:hypothetical protein